MSDEPSASTARQADNADYDNDVPGRRVVEERRKRNRRMFNKKREAFLGDLMRAVDILVYAELSTIYYMDCSFIRFVLRAFIQFVVLTPKPAFLPEAPAQQRPIGSIFGINILCLLLHTYFSAPEAGEATRGYLHGGLAMDFIGQKGPTSKIHLVLLDLLVLALQLVNLGIMLTKQKAKEASESSAAAPAPAAAQTVDFEERGQHRSDHQPVDIELQDLNSSGVRDAAPENAVENEREREALLSTSTPSSDSHIFDAFNSGEIMIADLNIFTLVREQFMNYKAAAAPGAEPRSTDLSSASFTGTNLGFRLRIGNRIWGI